MVIAPHFSFSALSPAVHAQSLEASDLSILSEDGKRVETLKAKKKAKPKAKKPAKKTVKKPVIKKASAPRSPAKRPLVPASANDPFFQMGYQKSMVNAGVGALWERNVDCREIVVAVIDTGVDYDHPDLSENIYRDADGQVIGRDFVNNDNDPMDDHYHGTAVAGIIGAQGNNWRGVAGVCWDAQIMPVKVLGKSGAGSLLGAMKAIDYASRNGAKIINNSYTSVTSVGKFVGVHPYLGKAFQMASARGSLAVLSAGNDRRDLNRVNAAYKAQSNMIYVGALDSTTNTSASFSAYGNRFVHLMAPGTDFTSTYPGGFYVSGLNGTSFSAPLAAGALASLWSLYGAKYSGFSGASKIKSLFLSKASKDSYISNLSVSGSYLWMPNLK